MENTDYQGTNTDLDSLIEGTDYATGEVIVKLKPGISSTTADEIRASLGASVVETTRTLGIELWSIKGLSVKEAIDLYSDNPFIEYIEPNYIVSVNTNEFPPNDPRFNEQWALNNTGQTGGTPDADINVQEAWEIATGQNVVIGVIDTGVDYTHPDLDDNIWRNPGEIAGNGIDDDGNGFIDDVFGWDFTNNDNDPFDDHGHGTHVAGTIAAEGNNDVGVIGVSWQSQIMALKFLDSNGSGSTMNAIRAIEYAGMMEADLTNNSWGGGGFSQALRDAIAANGKLFVAAAGNASNDNDTNPTYPASYDLDNIIAVAASDDKDQLAGFSNFGENSVDLAAPGVNILSTLPDERYGLLSGTSMAAPHVSGVASLLLSHEPNLSVMEVRDRILNGTAPIEPTISIPVQNRSVAQGRLSVRNFPRMVPPPTISFLETTYQVNENGTEAEITLERFGNVDLLMTMSRAKVFITGGTATAGIDYNDDTFPRTVVFEPTTTTATFTVPILDDSFIEGTEFIRFQLSTIPSDTFNGQIGNKSRATLQILDDDTPPPKIEFSQATYQVTENGIPVGAQVTLTRTGSANSFAQPSEVQIDIEGGTATGGSDYDNSNFPRTILFQSNETSKTFTIPIIEDSLFEGTEEIQFELSNAVNADIGRQNRASLQILDNDPPPAVPIYDFSAATFNTPEGNTINTTNVVTVTRSGGTSISSSVDVILSPSSAFPATPGDDFTSGPISLSFNLGETTKTVPIELLGDTSFEFDEIAVLSFTNFSSGGKAGTINPTALLKIVNDDLTNCISLDNRNNRQRGTQGDDCFDGLDGNDRIRGRRGNDTLLGGNGNDRLTGNSGEDILIGGSGNDRLTGNSEGDILMGDIGNDIIKGGSGDDLLDGGDDNDKLVGGMGNDTIIGGSGDDTIQGNAGTDIFVFAPNSDEDVINGFRIGQDLIDLSAYNFGFGSQDPKPEITQSGSKTLINLNNNDQITLNGVVNVIFDPSIFIV